MYMRDVDIDLAHGRIRIGEITISSQGEFGGEPGVLTPAAKEPDSSSNYMNGVIDLPVDPAAGDSHGEHDISFVSRHDIAETGLFCPVCRKQVTNRAEYGKVRTYRFPSGDTNEGIRCENTRVLNGNEVQCGTILLASPDTEHGDNLLMDQGKLSHNDSLCFVRKDRTEALRDQWGEDIEYDGTPNDRKVIKKRGAAQGFELPVDEAPNIIRMHDPVGDNLPEKPNYQDHMDGEETE